MFIINEGLAYAQMADLPPVTGLYVSLYSVVMYLILGTSNHLSIGNNYKKN
jgi:MFS superfamily sulfate permease-like transporter